MALSHPKLMQHMEDRVFTKRALAVCAAGLVVLYAVVLAGIFWVGKWVVDEHGIAFMTDFVWLWAGGRFALSSNPAAAYDPAAFAAIQAPLVGLAHLPGPLPYYSWIYPPTLFFAVALLGLMSYAPAFLSWVLATLCLFVTAVHKILPRGLAVGLALASPPAFFNAYIGQTGFLTAAFMGLSLAFMDRRPVLAGIFLGLLTYKPQFGLLFPLVLVVAGKWRVLVSAGATTLILAGTTALAFGAQAWEAFFRALAIHFDNNLVQHQVPWGMLQTVYGLMRWTGAPSILAWSIHITIALATALLVCRLWLRPVPYSLKAAALSLGSLIVTPYAFSYDLLVLCISGAFLVQPALNYGFMRGEKAILLCCFLALFLAALAIPVGPVVTAVLLGLVIRRADAAAPSSGGQPADVTGNLDPVGGLRIRRE
jgi:arabinofuranan 3-O-arabinosyltransferase